MTKNLYLISEAAKEVNVENHVLRYWEEELRLPVKRNEQGHRFYTKEDLDRFLYVKELKEQGLQLKAIRAILEGDEGLPKEKKVDKPERGLGKSEAKLMVLNASGLNKYRTKEEKQEAADNQEKAMRLQVLLKAMISEAVNEQNLELAEAVRETVQKELDYQFRIQEERETEREKERRKREEEHYKKLDEILRDKTEQGKRKKHSFW